MGISNHLLRLLNVVIISLCKKCKNRYTEKSDFKDSRKLVAKVINFSISGTTVLVEIETCIKCEKD